MSAIPSTPAEAASNLFGTIGPKLVDNKVFNANSNVETAQVNIAKSNEAQKMANVAKQQAELENSRTATKPKLAPEGNKGHNINTYA